jgi:serine/threonine protein kinase
LDFFCNNLFIYFDQIYLYLKLIDPESYVFVLEYANEGNLRYYLEKKFTSLTWNNKFQMALDIASGLKFLHSKEIIHRDLVKEYFFK